MRGERGRFAVRWLDRVRHRRVARVGDRYVTRDEPTAPQRLKFHIEIVSDELDGGYVAKVLEVPGVVSDGDTRDEAMRNVADALSEALATRIADAARSPIIERPPSPALFPEPREREVRLLVAS